MAMMHAIRVFEFGDADQLRLTEIARPRPGPGQLLVHVRAAGVGPWDGWVRSGRSVLPQPLPLTPGSDISGTVVDVGETKDGWTVGDDVFGVTNPNFTGGYAEYALADSGMIARKPRLLDHTAAAAVPVVASTAWQMLFDHARLGPGHTLLVHGAGGVVGSCVVQLAQCAGVRVVATTRPQDVEGLRTLGVRDRVNASGKSFECAAAPFDAVIDLVGPDTHLRSLEVLRRGGTLVSAVAAPGREVLHNADVLGVNASFMLVAVTTSGLHSIAKAIDAGHLRVEVGEILPLSQATMAHTMLEGAPHRRGKIVLVP